MAYKYELFLTTLAREDIIKIYNYICYNLFNQTAANSFKKSIFKALDTIRYFPNSFPIFNNEYFKEDSLRKIKVNNYLIIYVFEENVIKVLRIVYGARDYENIVKKIDKVINL
ncbi:MAG: type II toxin-antitoxin system RelE/ParE family toxin [Bacilli bacterium]|nr:type II toxin-antitoxin system RelE/ParE family toxin [Bacilli bacterium]